MDEDKVQTTNRKGGESRSGMHNRLVPGSNPGGGTILEGRGAKNPPI